MKDRDYYLDEIVRLESLLIGLDEELEELEDVIRSKRNAKYELINIKCEFDKFYPKLGSPSL